MRPSESSIRQPAPLRYPVFRDSDDAGRSVPILAPKLRMKEHTTAGRKIFEDDNVLVEAFPSKHGFLEHTYSTRS